MATKKSSSTRKKTSEKRGSGRKKASDRRDTEARDQLCAVVLFAFGILLFFFAVIPGESAWLAVHRFLLGCLSWCAYLVGPLVVCTAVMIATDQTGYPLAAKLTAATVLVLLFCGALQIFQREYPEGSLFELIAGLYEDGQALDGGGVFALLFGVPLLKLASFTGAVIIILLLIFIFLMILSGGTLMGLLRGASAPVKRLGEAYSSAVESRSTREEDDDYDYDWDEPPTRRSKRQEPVREREPRARDKKAKNEPIEEEPVYPDLPPPLTFPPAVLRKHTDIDVPIDGQPLPQHGERAPKTAIRPEPLPPDGMSIPGIKIPADPQPPKEEPPLTGEERLAAEAAELVRESFADDDLLARAVTGDTLLAHIPETAMGKLDFGGELPDDEAVMAASGLSAPPWELEPEPLPEPEFFPEPKPEPEPVSEPDPEPDISSREEPEKPLPVRLPDNTPHPDNTVAPSMGEVSEEPPYEYAFPSLDLLDEPAESRQADASRELRSNAELLENTLKSFGVQARIIDVSRGPAVTRYELQPAAGVKISKVTGLADDIALNLSAAGVRIEAPIPGKPAIGIEVPNKVVATVSIREMLDSPVFQNASSALTVALGRDITGGVTVGDISRMPHVLIAGATGSGKSVCINSIIISLLYKSSPEQVKFLMIDPKVVELGVYNGIPHLLVPVVTDPKKAAGSLAWAVGEMMKRYKLFAETGVRNLQGYNLLAEEREDMKPMPQVVIIIDELADLMMSSPKEVEDHICRLAQLARAAGMHLVIATQRPSVDVITGLIKANIPSRIAFAVSSAVDSRTILDGGGAEKLLGRGDMLFSPVGAPKPMRVQGCFVTDQEVERVVSFVKQGTKSDYDDEIMEEIDRQAAAGGKGGDRSSGGADSADEGEDELLAGAIEVVVEAGLASTSLLQRRLKVGYARAARLVDEMEQRGIVGPFEGSKPRQVLLSKERYYEMKLMQED